MKRNFVRHQIQVFRENKKYLRLKKITKWLIFNGKYKYSRYIEYFDSLEMQQQFPETAEKIIAN